MSSIILLLPARMDEELLPQCQVSKTKGEIRSYMRVDVLFSSGVVVHDSRGGICFQQRGLCVYMLPLSPRGGLSSQREDSFETPASTLLLETSLTILSFSCRRPAANITPAAHRHWPNNGTASSAPSSSTFDRQLSPSVCFQVSWSLLDAESYRAR